MTSLPRGTTVVATWGSSSTVVAVAVAGEASTACAGESCVEVAPAAIYCNAYLLVLARLYPTPLRCVCPTLIPHISLDRLSTGVVAARVGHCFARRRRHRHHLDHGF